MAWRGPLARVYSEARMRAGSQPALTAVLADSILIADRRNLASPTAGEGKTLPNLNTRPYCFLLPYFRFSFQNASGNTRPTCQRTNRAIQRCRQESGIVVRAS